ncbi:MAG: nucleotidyltransferase domain-containing protein [Actinomycetota bacterium]|nr:nucleotidyltransferase domain-containing protein [Actinomycetota bacterium]
MTQRINITLPSDLLAAIDEAAAGEHLTRSGFLRAAALERVAGQTGAGVVREAPAVYAAPGPRAIGFDDREPRTWPPSPDTAAALLSVFFAARDDVEVAYLFGSVARGDARPASDVDVAVLLSESLTAEERWNVRLDLIGRLSLVFRTDAIELILPDEVALELALAVIEEGLVVAGAHRASRLGFERSVRERAERERPSAEARRRAVRERILSGDFFDRHA